MRLATPKNYVDEYGIVETGRLLTNKEVIDPATSDDKASYKTAMYDGGELKDSIKTELNRYIDAAGDEIIPKIRRFLKWPLQNDGFALEQSDVPSELTRIALEVARYYLHDEDVRGVEEVSFIERRYRNALTIAGEIGSGDRRLSGVDTRYEDIESKTIYSI